MKCIMSEPMNLMINETYTFIAVLRPMPAMENDMEE
jgi:hypothetical protein